MVLAGSLRRRGLRDLAVVSQLCALSPAELSVAGARLLGSRASWDVVRCLCAQSAIAENYDCQNFSTSYRYLWMCKHSAIFFFYCTSFKKSNT